MRELTEKFLKTADLERRKAFWQYMTPDAIRSELWKGLSEVSDLEGVRTALEPSAGTGEFLAEIIAKTGASEVSFCELEDGLREDLVSEFVRKKEKGVGDAKAPAVSFSVGTDYLRHVPETEYDLIVGNPPYFETSDSELRSMFPHAGSGRMNVGLAFVEKAFSELRDGGTMAFVLPSSFNSGRYSSDVRRFLVEKGELVWFRAYGPSEFSDANQSVSTWIVKKVPVLETPKPSKFVVETGNGPVFSENAEAFEAYSKGRESLYDMGLRPFTGPFVWNQRKGEIRETGTETSVMLVWAHNISEGKLEASSRRPQYAETSVPRTVGPAMVFNRIVGKSGAGRLKGAYVPAGFEFVGENHVNVVAKPSWMGEPEFRRIFDRITSADHSAALSLIGSTQLSSRELGGLLKF